MTTMRTLLQAAGLSCWLSLGAGAMAQDIPHIDAVGAYNHANVMARPNHAPRGPEAEATEEDAASGELSQEEMDRIVEGLQAGYRKRLERDGKVVADAWLERQAARLKEQYTTIR